ncbi:MAG: lipoprotein, partial [Ramlibacter sp.]|nr:lipoprotein [Ramlibacter sp.]
GQQRFSAIHVFRVGHYNFTMFHVPQILVSARLQRVGLAAVVVAMLAACGQKGPLFLPTGESAQGRPTLPQILNPSGPAAAASAPNTPTGTANPVPRP